MPFRTLLLALVTLAIFSAPTRAALVERDFLVPGDGLLIYDTVNQREWLDLAVTERVDLAGLAAALAPGGPLEGFGLASIEHVEAIAFSAGVTWQTTIEMDPDSYETASQWIDLLESSAVDVRDMLRDEIEVLPPLPPERVIVSGGNGIADDIDGQVDYVYDSETGERIDFDDDTLFEITLESLGIRVEEGVAFDPNAAEDNPQLPPLLGVFVASHEARADRINVPLALRYSSGGVLRSFDFDPTQVNGPYWLTRTAVPEPSTLALLLSGSLVFSCRRRRCVECSSGLQA